MVTDLETTRTIFSVAVVRRLVDESEHLIDHLGVVDRSVEPLLGDLDSLFLDHQFLLLAGFFLSHFLVDSGQSLLTHKQTA